MCKVSSPFIKEAMKFKGLWISILLYKIIIHFKTILLLHIIHINNIKPLTMFSFKNKQWKIFLINTLVNKCWRELFWMMKIINVFRGWNINSSLNTIKKKEKSIWCVKIGKNYTKKWVRIKLQIKTFKQ
jgi:hypothetical protein